MLVELVNTRTTPGSYEESYLTDDMCIILYRIDFKYNKISLKVIDRNNCTYVKPSDELVDIFTARTKMIMQEPTICAN